MTQSFNIRIRPKPKQRPRFAGHAYTPAETQKYEERIAYEVYRQGATKMQGPIFISIGFFYKRPKRMKNPERHTKRPDLDNLIKGVLDALNGVLWDDDAQIASLDADKWYAEEDAILISVSGDEP